jgi:thymidine kinase
MKINYTGLITVLEKKSNRAISRLDELKCYTPEFQETLESILKMLAASKEIEKYDTECVHCKESKQQENNQPNESNEPAPTRESQVGKPYKTFKEEDYE